MTVVLTEIIQHFGVLLKLMILAITLIMNGQIVAKIAKFVGKSVGKIMKFVGMLKLWI